MTQKRKYTRKKPPASKAVKKSTKKPTPPVNDKFAPLDEDPRLIPHPEAAGADESTAEEILETSDLNSATAQMAEPKGQKKKADGLPAPIMDQRIASRVHPEWVDGDFMVGFPTYKDTNPGTLWSLVAMSQDLGKNSMRFEMEMGDAMIYHARNKIAERFLASACKWLLFLDDDMVFPVGRPDALKMICRLPNDYPDRAAGLHTATRLMGHGHTLVGASYFFRHNNSIAVNSLSGDSGYRSRVMGFHDGTMECDWVGTGCLLIHRKVFEDIKERFPQLAPNYDEMPWNFFHPGEDGRGEDIAFCHRARDCGHQPYVDTALHALHVGRGIYGSHTSAYNNVL